MSKSKKIKVVTMNGKKYDVIYREHDARSTTTRDLLNLFVIHTMDSYVLIPHKEFPVKNTITIQVTDHIKCSILGDINSAKHKLQPLLNRINFANIDTDKVDSIAINLNAAMPDGTVQQTVTVWEKSAPQVLKDELMPEPEKDKKKKKDKK